MFPKILVPLDGSELAERALLLATRLAAQGGSRLILLRVPVFDLPESLLPPVVERQGARWQEYTAEDAVRAATTYLERIAAGLAVQGIQVETRVVEGDPAGIILDLAEMEQISLIVMSPRGITGLARWVFGSVTERVLRQAPCPVLVSRATADVRRVFITLDGSSLAEHAIAPGLDVAQRLGCPVTLLRVEPPVANNLIEEMVIELALADNAAVAQLTDVALANAALYLNDVVERYAQPGRILQKSLLVGKAAERIVGTAEQEADSLIVMASHGRTGLQRWVYGSVTEKVMRSADASLLIIRSAFASRPHV